MIILVELLIILVLLMTIVTLVFDEINHRKRAKHLVKIKEYWNGSERRRVERYNATLDVSYSINHKLKNSKTKDISTHGLGLILEEKLERKTPLLIEIKIDGVKDPIKAKAHVMWSKEAIEDEKYSPKRLFLTGIKFSRFSDSPQEKKLFDYIRTLEKESFQEDAKP